MKTENNQPGKAGYGFVNVSDDERRSIYANTEILSGKEVSIIKLNKGKAIGGCLHNKDEYWCILSGEVIVSIGLENIVCMSPDSGTFYSGTPHAFYAMVDSIIMEWGISTEDKKDSPKDEDMLNRVKELNLK
jgi:mannose-6-phosphate isomerase-like protein (cupin superfamily)